MDHPPEGHINVCASTLYCEVQTEHTRTPTHTHRSLHLKLQYERLAPETSPGPLKIELAILKTSTGPNHNYCHILWFKLLKCEFFFLFSFYMTQI